MYTGEHPGRFGPVSVDILHIMACPDYWAMLDDSLMLARNLSCPLGLHPQAHSVKT